MGADGIAVVIAHFATPDLNANANWFSSHNLWLDSSLVFGIPTTLILLAAIVIAFVAAIANGKHRDTRALLIALLGMGLLGSVGDWVMVMPALILPVVMMAMTRLEATFATRRARSAPLDRAAQSPVPDQAG